MAGWYSLEDVRDSGAIWIPIVHPIHLRVVIRNALLSALGFYEGVQQDAAKALDISPRMMGYMMRTYSIPSPTAKKHRLEGSHVGTRKEKPKNRPRGKS